MRFFTLFITLTFSLLHTLSGHTQCTTQGHVSPTTSIGESLCFFTGVNNISGIGAGSERTYTGFNPGELYELYMNLNGANISCVQGQWYDNAGNPIGGWFAISTDPQNPTIETAPPGADRLRVTTESTGAWVNNSALLNYKNDEDCEEITIDEEGTIDLSENGCGMLFYDSGGPNGNYQNNEDYTITFCSGTGQSVKIEFISFNTEDNGQSGRQQVRYDILDVYDGPSTASDQMYSLSGVAQGTNQPPVVVSSGECITFRFTSNGSNTRPGWEAFVSCTDDENNTATNFCETAPTICNIDGYVGNTSDFYNIESVGGQVTNGGQFFPNNAALDNNSFIKFIADDTQVVIDIGISDCTPPSCGTNIAGIQMVILEGTNCNFTSTVASYTTGLTQGSHTITLNGLTPGGEYYLMVDGYNCSVCNYTMDAVSGISFATVDPTEASICPGETVDITASGGSNYVWSGTGVDGETTPTVTVSDEGTYSVVISGGNPACPENIELTSTVTFETATDIDPYSPEEVCGSFTFPDITGTDLSGSEAYYTEPNGQGTSYQPGESISFDPNATYPISIYVSDPNLSCSDEEILELTILENPEIDEPSDVNECDNYSLPPLSNGEYFGSPDGNDPIAVGTSIDATQTVYVYAETSTTPVCVSEHSFTVTITPNQTPEFDAVSDICEGESIDPLPTTSNNGITGSWSPAINNTQTTTYTFTPNDDTCTDEVTLTIEVTDQIIPNFDQVDAICSGESLDPLPTTSTNGVTGSWSPAVNNTQTTTYTFTPDDDGCTATASMTIEVNPSITPTFTQVDAICVNEPLDNLPTTSNNGVTGSWSPVMDNTQTTTYTFTPNAGECAETTTMTIEVNPGDTPTFDAIGPICEGENFTLPTTSTNGIVGEWTPAPNFTQTTQYTFVPTSPCATSTTLTVTVNPAPNISAGNDISVCAGESIILSGSGGSNYSWTGGIQNGVPFTPPSGVNTYTVTGEVNGCTGTDQVTVTVGDDLAVNFIADETDGCSFSPITFENITPGNSSQCIWDLGDGTIINGCDEITHTYSQTGCFSVTLTVISDEGCVSNFTQNDYVCIKSGPIADFIADPMVVTVTDPSVTFNNESIGAVSYEWDFGDESQVSFQENPSHTFPSEPDEFYEVVLYATNELGCTDSTVRIIEVQEDLIFWVPNAFTPDGNDRNEIFQPVFTSGFDPLNFNLLIFNRWGEVLFESNNAAVGWDGTYGGKVMPDGTYTWKIEFRNKYTDKRELHTGHVVLLR